MSVHWSAPNHTPIKSRCLITICYQIWSSYLSYIKWWMQKWIAYKKKLRSILPWWVLGTDGETEGWGERRVQVIQQWRVRSSMATSYGRSWKALKQITYCTILISWQVPNLLHCQICWTFVFQAVLLLLHLTYQFIFHSHCIFSAQ